MLYSARNEQIIHLKYISSAKLNFDQLTMALKEIIKHEREPEKTSTHLKTNYVNSSCDLRTCKILTPLKGTTQEAIRSSIPVIKRSVWINRLSAR